MRRTFEWDQSFDAPHYFDEVIGINVDDDYDIKEIKVRVYGRQRAYFESLPLYITQRVVESYTNYTDYIINVRPEYEFQHEILRLGQDAEVLSPKWLRDEMAWLNEEALKRYKE